MYVFVCVWMHTLGKELNLCIAYWEVNKYCLIQEKTKKVATQRVILQYGGTCQNYSQNRGWQTF